MTQTQGLTALGPLVGIRSGQTFDIKKIKKQEDEIEARQRDKGKAKDEVKKEEKDLGRLGIDKAVNSRRPR